MWKVQPSVRQSKPERNCDKASGRGAIVYTEPMGAKGAVPGLGPKEGQWHVKGRAWVGSGKNQGS
jgi:hypothetical protein